MRVSTAGGLQTAVDQRVDQTANTLFTTFLLVLHTGYIGAGLGLVWAVAFVPRHPAATISPSLNPVPDCRDGVVAIEQRDWGVGRSGTIGGVLGGGLAAAGGGLAGGRLAASRLGRRCPRVQRRTGLSPTPTSKYTAVAEGFCLFYFFSNGVLANQSQSESKIARIGRVGIRLTRYHQPSPARQMRCALVEVCSRCVCLSDELAGEVNP